jgi:hypothetical protein
MREIFVSTEVFSLIWSKRLPGEESENDILLRLLSNETLENLGIEVVKQPVEELVMSTIPASLRHAYWWEVLEFVLEKLGRPAGLNEIYRGVASVCNALGKPMPDAIEATIRGTLEDNSSDSDRFKHVRDIFCMPEGKHSGIWALRRKKP